MSRKHIILDVLECARDNEDTAMIRMCKGLLSANRLGWSKHNATHWRVVTEIHDQINEAAYFQDLPH